MTYEKIERLFEIPKSTLGYVLRRHNKLRVIGPLPKGSTKMIVKVTPGVSRAVVEGNFTLTLEELKAYVIQKFQISEDISITTIHRLLE